MADQTDVYLITGFLGSGKTTLLNRVIHAFPRDRKLTILVNEFGEIGVDGDLVADDEIDMMEISKGSIFCVCVKTDFIKGLYSLNTTVKPDVLLIESTGVANPSDLKRDLQLPIFNDRYHFKEQFCVIDAVHFLDAYQAFASLEKQIASSSVFVINKSDLASTETVNKIKTVVEQFHPDPFYFLTRYADIPLERFFNWENKVLAQQTGRQPTMDISPTLSMEQLEAYLDGLLDSPDLQITPPDMLMSITFKWTGDQLQQIEDLAGKLPADVVRAKGFVESAGRVHLFNYVMGDWTLDISNIPLGKIRHPDIIVFIAPPGSIEKVENLTGTGNWINLGSHQPYTR